MTSRDFVYFLQGFFELTNPKEINAEQTELIKRHLNLVFKHEIDPSMGDQKHQDELNEIHSGNQNNQFIPNHDKFRDEDGAILRC